MALVTKDFTFSAGAVIVASQHNTNFDTLYNVVNGNLNTSNLASNAAIVDTQLASITTTGKVNLSALTVASQATGDLIYASSASVFTRRAIGSSADVLTVSGGVPTWAVPATQQDAFSYKLLHVRDEKTAGTTGGGFTAGSFVTRVLQTVKTNEISGASLASNAITLPAGTYFVEASAPAYFAAAHKVKIRNTSDASDVLIGTSEDTPVATADSQTRSFVKGRFTLAAEKVIELQHQCGTTSGTHGLGRASNFAVVEVYAEVMIWKIA